ncbi:MAG: lysylphosphatidylglycerol synthase transmembrane domain-containing protein [Gemmatimonadaceae bacterium]
MSSVSETRRRGTLRRVVRWGVTVAILLLLVEFARQVDWAATWGSIRGASPGLLAAATAVNLLTLVVKGVRWWIFLRPAGARSLGLAVRATTAGAGLNNVLVANGGDAARVVFVTRSTGLPSATVLATLALERVFDAVGYVLLLVGAALVLPLPAGLARFRVPAEMALVGMVGALGVLALRRPAAAAPAAAVAEIAVPASILGRARRYLRRFASSVRELSTAPRFAGALALSMLSWVGQLACFHLTALAAGAPLPVAGSLVALLAVNAGLLVRATPGNVGVFQLAYALAATQFGVAREPAIAVALLIQTLQILPTTLLGVILAPEFVLRRGGAPRSAAS